MDLVKVAIAVQYDDGDSEIETLWAAPLGADNYRLENSPFYAYSVSWKDEVYAPQSADGMPTFQSVVRKSGHRTIRVALECPYEEGNASAREMDSLVSLGCSFEGAAHRLMSIDIPPQVNLSTIREHLMSRGLQWEHADPTYEQLFPEGDQACQ